MRESDIEQQLIEKLKDLKYTYRPDIRDRASLEKNFREKFEALNLVKLTDNEYARLTDQIITADVFEAARILRETNSFERDDGTPLFYTLVNIKDWCKNSFEVIHQLRINTDNSHHRYDVLLLMNGVPVVQIELKALEVLPQRAMQQIVDYKNDAGNGYGKTLLCFLQLFVVSNQSSTRYFANNNLEHFQFDAQERFLPVYEFANQKNQKIMHLDAFAEKFFGKCSLSQTISRYMVLVASEKKLLMMRPYQMYAVQAMLECIQQNSGNGYIWHTTGSGKTLTSFKASTLLKDNPEIEKCLFVVDRKDLDKQTREEFNRFQAGCVEQNTNTDALVRRLVSGDYADKVIVTTIQKLGLALDESNTKYKQLLEPLRQKRMAIIFDECHRSQFGENHQAIKAFFPKAQLFGFTGTPIFEQNATHQQVAGEEASYKTTKDIFQNELHAYTITNAINDANVLRFRVDYFKPEGTTLPKPGEALAKRAVIQAILERHDTTTAHRKFNAILATASINDAIEYHKLFVQVQAEKQAADPEYTPLKIACVFSPPAYGNKDVQQIQEDLPQEQADNQQAPEEKKAALEQIIESYNAQYGTNHRIGEFDGYYQDVQKRIKDQQYPLAHSQKIDIVIVVDMLLTGFDSKYLNTLYVDKNLKHHGLIQAFSRTNRILNESKPYGNILDFRQQEDAVNQAITLFSGESSDNPKEIWLVEAAPVVVEKLEQAVRRLDLFMQSQGLTCAPAEVHNLKGDAAKSTFINLFKEIQKLNTRLEQYTDLTEEQQAKVQETLPENQLQAFKGVYLETAQKLKEKQDKQKDKATPELQQLDFGFVLFASALIDYDYIMSLLARYSSATPSKQSLTREQLIALIASDAKFMNEREDITEYIQSLQAGAGLSEQRIREGYESFKQQKNKLQLENIASKHELSPETLQTFVDEILRRRIFDGERLSLLLEPLGLGWKARKQKEEALMTDLIPELKKRADGRDISGLSAYEQ
jgi:type I restriction enzyme, R subunit